MCGTNSVYRSHVDSTQPPTNLNKRLGANIQRLRKAKGMSQADLARELTARGFPFQHQGILKLEGGARPLRFAEGLAIAEIFDVNPAMLSDPPTEVAALAAQLYHVLSDMARITSLIAEQEENLQILHTAKTDIELRLADAGAAKSPSGRWWWVEDEEPKRLTGAEAQKIIADLERRGER
jgi:transcriptional regulator with XRE-family HTH domain